MKNIIAIIGASGTLGTFLAQKLVAAEHRILLMDSEIEKADKVYSEIRMGFPDSDIDKIECAHSCSWEADIIISLVPDDLQEAVALKIKEVVTGKIVISFANSVEEISLNLAATKKLQQLLPYSKVVRAFTLIPLSESRKTDCYVVGNDKLIVDTVCALVKEAGFNPVPLDELSKNHPIGKK